MLNYANNRRTSKAAGSIYTTLSINFRLHALHTQQTNQHTYSGTNLELAKTAKVTFLILAEHKPPYKIT